MNKKSLLKYIIFIITGYIILSSVLLISDRSEPKKRVFDIAFPKADDKEADKTIEEISDIVAYTPVVDEVNVYTQVIYTPKIITGIDLWMRGTGGAVASTYTLSFYNADWTPAFSTDFTAACVSDSGYTRIVFPDFSLAEGRQYIMVISRTTAGDNNIVLGLVPDMSTWGAELYDVAGFVEGSILCFNLLYDYQNWGFINWMVLNIIVVLAFIYLIKKCASNNTIKHTRLLGTLLFMFIAAAIVIFVLLYSGYILG